VEIFQFDRAEKVIQAHGSAGLRVTRVAAGDGPAQLTCLVVEPGKRAVSARRAAGSAR
jgi:hypothetical protein